MSCRCCDEATERHEVEAHHAFRGIEFPEAAKPGCLSATTPCCLRSGPGTLDRRPLTTTPEHTTYFLAGCIAFADFHYYSLLDRGLQCAYCFESLVLQSPFAHLSAPWLLQLSPSMCFLSPVYVSPTIGMRSRPPRSWMMADTCFSLGFTRRRMSMLPSMRAQRLCRTYGS